MKRWDWYERSQLGFFASAIAPQHSCPLIASPRPPCWPRGFLRPSAHPPCCFWSALMEPHVCPCGLGWTGDWVKRRVVMMPDWGRARVPCTSSAPVVFFPKGRRDRDDACGFFLQSHPKGLKSSCSRTRSWLHRLDATQLSKPQKRLHISELLLQHKNHTDISWKPQGYPTDFLILGMKGGKVTVFSVMDCVCTSPLIGKCEIICRTISSKNLCSVEMKDVFLIQIRYHCNFSWPLHTSFPSVFLTYMLNSLFKILGFILCSTITPPPIICHFPNWFSFLLLSLQCNTVSLLTWFLVSHHPFFLHLPCLCQMFCNLLMLTNTLSLSPLV